MRAKCINDPHPSNLTRSNVREKNSFVKVNTHSESECRVHPSSRYCKTPGETEGAKPRERKRWLPKSGKEPCSERVQ